MKTFALLLAFSLVASSAPALIDDGTESLGVYFDQTGDTNWGMPALFTPFNLYFIMARPAVPSIGAFELSWRYNPEPAIQPPVLALTLPPGAVNTGDPHNMIVSLSLGLPTSDATVLATVNTMFLTAVPILTFLQVGPTVPATHPGFMSYAGFADPETIRHMGVFPGPVDGDGWSFPGVFCFGCPPPPTATESATMSAIKALFQ